MGEKAGEDVEMPAEVDFSESIPNPYADELRRADDGSADEPRPPRPPHCPTVNSAWKYPRRARSSSKPPCSQIRPSRST